MNPVELVPLIVPWLPPDGRFVVADGAVASAVLQQVPGAVAGPGADLGPDPVDGVLMLSGEIAAAGERGPVVLHDAVRRCRPGAVVAVAVPSAIHQAVSVADDDVPGLSGTQVQHILAERGLEVIWTAAPGAAARLAGRGWAVGEDLSLDRTPGLLDAGPVILGVAHTPRSEAERTRTFFSSIARKIVSSSALCSDDNDRILTVFDSFKRQWTLPGGLIDAGENPIAAAVREVWEEGGVRVRAGELLGVFTHAMPDRINLVYAAAPLTGPGLSVPEHPVPVHPHEIAEVRWVERAEALTLLDGDWPRKVTACLQQPGGTWTF